MPTDESKNTNESGTTEELQGAVTDDNGGIIDQTPPAAQPEPEEPEQPEIDSFTTMEVAGIKYILGLGLDSKVYNWDINAAKWKLFILKRDIPGAPADPLDSVL